PGAGRDGHRAHLRKLDLLPRPHARRDHAVRAPRALQRLRSDQPLLRARRHVVRHQPRAPARGTPRKRPAVKRLLPDIVAADLDVLIVAINPSVRSAEAGYSFTSKGNPFWRLLHASGLTPELLKPEEGARLTEFSIDLASGVQRATRT